MHLKKFVSSIVVMLCLSLFVGGCSDNKVSMVKNGTLEFDKSLTVGQALDNYKYFTKTKWEAITTENGKKVVQVIGQIALDNHPSIKNPELKAMDVRFQFIVNQDKTFELGWCGAGFEKMNGEKVEPNQNANLTACFQWLEGIYNNSPNI